MPRPFSHPSTSRLPSTGRSVCTSASLWLEVPPVGGPWSGPCVLGSRGWAHTATCADRSHLSSLTTRSQPRGRCWYETRVRITSPGSPEDRPVAGQFWEGCGSALQAREGGDGGRRVAVPGPWALLLLCHPGSRQFLCQSSPTRPASTSSSRGWAGSQRHAHTLPPSGVLASWTPPQPTGDPSPT